MALSDAIQGARKRGQVITWTTKDGEAEDLTDLTLSGVIRSRFGSTTTKAITGDLAVVDGEAGQFSWSYSASDVSEANDYMVQFVATDGGGLKVKTFAEPWTVQPGYDEA